MSEIRTLLEGETQIAPRTFTTAVMNLDGDNLDEIIEEISTVVEGKSTVVANPTATGEEGSLQRIEIDGESYLLAADTTEFTEQEIQTIWNEVM